MTARTTGGGPTARARASPSTRARTAASTSCTRRPRSCSRGCSCATRGPWRSTNRCWLVPYSMPWIPWAGRIATLALFASYGQSNGVAPLPKAECRRQRVASWRLMCNGHPAPAPHATGPEVCGQRCCATANSSSIILNKRRHGFQRRWPVESEHERTRSLTGGANRR
jgi:hypothetical protein